MLYLAWDIDGTLLLTNRAGYDALQEAIQEYFRVKGPYEFKHSLAGCTDSAIIKEIVTDIKGRCTSGWAAGLMLTYEMRMKQTIRTHQGNLMPNVAKTLDYIRDNEPEITNVLMTGNTTGGARDKVTHYGIDRYFDYTHSSYGDLAEKREDVAKILYTRLRIDNSVSSPEQIIFIGDTPNDVKAASAIGCRCIVVLAGSEFCPEDFAEATPWKMLDRLPDDPSAFIKLLKQETE